MESLKFDVAVIGAGPTGLAAASDLNAAGKKVVVIEQYLWGGTCPNYGCDPKKLLLAGVEAREAALAFQDDGLQATVKIDWPKLMERKNRYTQTVPSRTVASLDASGIAHLYGKAEFIDAKQLKVTDGETETLVQASDYVLAVGQRPNAMAIPGAELTIDSERFLSLAEMPAEMVIIGGGYIALEFASIAAAAGSKVHVLVRGSQVLKGFDADFADELVEQLSDRGVHFYFDTEATAITKVGTKLKVALSFGTVLEVGVVVRAVGRRANSDRLALEKAGVDYNPHGVNVNEYLQTTNPHIFAAGDVANTPVARLTSTGGFEGHYVAQFINGQTKAAIAYPPVPITVFGTPKIAAVGIPADQAEAKGYTVKKFDMTNWYSYYRLAERKVLAKVVLNSAGEIVGATVLGSHADELVNYFIDLINRHESAATIQKHLYVYPSLASDLGYLL